MQKNTKDLSTKKSNINESIDAKTNVVKEEVNTNAKKRTSGSSSKKPASKKKTAVTSKTATKKNTAKKSVTKKVTSKKTVAQKATAKKTTAKKATVKKASATTRKSKSETKAKTKRTARKNASPKKPQIIEYYDLPYRYNQTIVKILAQTPNTIFVYWDISDSDREKYINQFGEDFFNTTYPVLIVHNKTMNYSFEIEINDFANSWYFNVNDAKCDYEIELGRRSKPNTITLPNNYMYVTSSNVIESPNNHILFEKNQKVLFFRNVKNNTTYSKNVSQFNFMKYIGRVYNIYDIYRKIYKTEELQNIENNPSSSFNKGEF